DVGLADPQALVVVEAAAAAFERVGLPEGQFHLTQAALYLATTAKSNSTLGYFDALQAVEREREDAVPVHLKDASRDKEGFGHGEGYLYPHAYRDHWVAQQYLPEALQGKTFYQPSDQGYEAGIKADVERRREEQIAAMLESETTLEEALTFSPTDRAQERWLRRAISDAGRRMGEVRDKLFAAVPVHRHHLILDLNAGSGLLTWEALRLAPEGGVWALARDARSADTLRRQAAQLSELGRPVILQGDLDDLDALLAEAGYDDVRYDLLVGRNVLTQRADRAAILGRLASRLRVGGAVSLAEAVPRRAQRLYRLVDTSSLDADLVARLIECEEAIYADPDDPMTNWDAADLEAALADAGYTRIQITAREVETEHLVTAEQVARWFGVSEGSRPTYGQHLAKGLAEDEVARVRGLLLRQLAGQTVSWHSTIAYAVAYRE
ncbi:MAG TPA: AAA family ATPase, partial [Chloroflexi bacterium]|nr:AAA family ATPase [Chloroflexota bacterium]